MFEVHPFAKIKIKSCHPLLYSTTVTLGTSINFLSTMKWLGTSPLEFSTRVQILALLLNKSIIILEVIWPLCLFLHLKK